MKGEHPYLSDVQKIIHENINEYWKIKGLEYNQPQIWSLEFKGARSELVLQQSKSYLRLLQCVTPLVKWVTAYVSSCASGGETESQASSSHSLICCAVTFPEEWHFISRQHTRGRGGTPSSSPSASPLPPNLIPELLSPALELRAPGLWSLIFQHIPVFIWGWTHKSHLCFSSDSAVLGWKWTAWQGANLTSGLLIFPPGFALGFQHSHTALILEKKPDLAGVCWGGIWRQMSDCFGNI